MSRFGEWTTADGLPAFRYRAGETTWDPIIGPPSSRHCVHVGNRRITLVADTDGLSGVWDEHTSCLWLAEHTGIGRLGGTCTENPAEILFGPTFFRVTTGGLERTVLCPEGEDPWVLIRVAVRTDAPARLMEEWEVRPRLLNLEFGEPWDTEPLDTPEVLLEHLGGERQATTRGRLRVEVDLEPGEHVLWFRFGLDGAVTIPEGFDDLRDRLPDGPDEIKWHAALLTGGACVDGVLGGHTLDQGSAYSYRYGFNGAARDPLQHALPLVHIEPDLALSVLRNTCAWGSPDGDLPYALNGRKQPWTGVFRPSDQNLWALWLAAEYAAATGDHAAFANPVAYHPVHDAEPVSLQENLRRQFRFFVDEVGLGEHGHVRILNADWNDMAITESGVDRAVMIERGESVLNSAMAAWVLPVYADLAARLGDQATAAQARSLGADLRVRVAGEWNGRWFRRAYGDGPIGDDQLWLEVQPWAILSGAAEPGQARELLVTIDRTCRAGSPLGARIRAGGPVWFAVSMTLVWAAIDHDIDLAWDEWRRMTLHAHTTAYPDIWSGTLSGPDAYLPPEADRPGETWASPELGVAMQTYPVANLHSHSQPLLAHQRLSGIDPCNRKA
jgi:Glycosyl hydrolase 36 superfamily, catalytic domain